MVRKLLSVAAAVAAVVVAVALTAAVVGQYHDIKDKFESKLA